MKIIAKTVNEYIRSLPIDRADAIAQVRGVILKNLPAGYEEGILYGMICYYIPFSRYPKTYNDQPLMFAAVASQKNYMSVYLTSIYANQTTESWFREQYKATGKKLDMGKSCVRFETIDDLPLELVGEVIARTPVESLIEIYEMSRRK